MSGPVRTIQKRILKKKLGFARQTMRVTDTGSVRLAKGEGNIIDGTGTDTGSRHYPRLV